jgi:hypothetical protein
MGGEIDLVFLGHAFLLSESAVMVILSSPEWIICE